MTKRRKLVWDDNGQAKVAYGSGYDFTGSGTSVIFHGEQGDIVISTKNKFTIT